MTITLRSYQSEFINDLRSAMRESRRVVGVMATGAGKTCSFSYMTNTSVQNGRRVLIVVHRMEILKQISTALSEYNLPHGWICPGRTMTRDACQIGMIQTVARRLDQMEEPGLIVVDECHHAVSQQYASLLAKWPKAFVIGVTATPQRLDGKPLGDIFNKMVIGPQTRQLIDMGYLAKFDYLAPQLAEFSGVKTQMGDYSKKQTEQIMDGNVITGSAVAHYRNYLVGKTAIAFCITVAHAEHVAETFRASGISSCSIDGKMLPYQRERICSQLADGELKVMTSCELVSEGFDLPSVNGAILLRPSKSLAMVRQMVGRVLRLKKDGSNAVILDHVANVEQHGMPDRDIKWSLDGSKKEQFSVTTCKACYKTFATGKDWRKTAECGRELGQEDCALVPSSRAQPEGGGGRAITEQDGQLVAITDSPEWSGGINIVLASGPEWKALIQRADTLDKLKQISVMRGYKRGWAAHVLRERKSKVA